MTLPATDFTPLLSGVGGLLIGASVVVLMALNGKIAGISGIAGRLVNTSARGPLLEQLLFVAGLVGGAAVVALVAGGVPQHLPPSLGLLAVAGLLVGFGATIGQGCTSGHGVCGIARLSVRSLTATLVFMGVAILVTFLMRHVGGLS
ncbi:YeeE/YedE family protein [Aquabacter sp. L1I39]|uniref:YeeE/YedE family protein n=1 Tax=Aquabacter sp. L1I39 TaxID=2820278 RepID=UPI001FFC7BBE|nr:YeeE/YedE thiosulfate transporter family protein [Aquabacter sp. L1I39]